MDNNTFDEATEKGIEAIIYLQKLVGIEETREQAVVGWSRMSKHERQFTMKVCEVMKDEMVG